MLRVPDIYIIDDFIEVIFKFGQICSFLQTKQIKNFKEQFDMEMASQEIILPRIKIYICQKTFNVFKNIVILSRYKNQKFICF